MKAITTVPPYAPYLNKIAEHPIVEGFRLNTVMPIKESLDELLTRLVDVAGGKDVWIDLNPTMCAKAQANAEAVGITMECHEGQMENIPLPDSSVDVVISNGVINLSFRKRRVIEEVFRTLRSGGRISITDIVSAKQLSQSIVNDPLTASVLSLAEIRKMVREMLKKNRKYLPHFKSVRL